MSETSQEGLQGEGAAKIALTPKGERTRARILDSALELFLERGYDGTTMRDVADSVGVSVGNAYYYFSSKEHLVQGFYERTDAEHQALVRPLLGGERNLRRRLELVLRTKIETAAPYHRFAGVLFRTAADPSSSLNPFSDASRETRESAVALMREVVDGSGARIAPDLLDELPSLLCLFEMSVILYWIHDESEGFERTGRLIDHGTRLIAGLLRVSGLPLMRPVRARMLRMVADLRPLPRDPVV